MNNDRGTGMSWLFKRKKKEEKKEEEKKPGEKKPEEKKK
jgi:hypothetical protein